MVPNAAPRRYVRSRVRADAPHLLGTDLAAHGALAQVLGLVDTLPHPAQCAELAGPGQHGALAVDLEVLEGVVADADADRAVAVARLEVLLPQIRRLEDMPVAIDQHGIRAHRVSAPLPALARRADALPLHLDAGGLAVPGVGGHALRAQHVLLHLLRRRLGQLVDDAHVARHHEVRHARQQERDQVGRDRGAAPSAERHHDQHLVLADLARHGDGRRLLHRGMRARPRPRPRTRRCSRRAGGSRP